MNQSTFERLYVDGKSLYRVYDHQTLVAEEDFYCPDCAIANWDDFETFSFNKTFSKSQVEAILIEQGAIS